MGQRAGRVTAIVAKDLRLFARDRFYLFISVLTLVFVGGVFWLLPATTETTLSVGVHLPDAAQLLQQGLATLDEDALAAVDDGAFDGTQQEGFEIVGYGSHEKLEHAVGEGEVVAGLSFPAGFLDALAAGRATTVQVLLAADAPEGVRPALTSAVRELTFALAGEQPPVTLPTLEEQVLGTDRAGDPLSLRDQLRPLLVFLVLLMEMFALASLVAVEIAQRTATAVLVTPARVSDLLAAKTVLGTGLAFGQALLIALVTGTIAGSPGLVVLALLLGAVLATGFGLLAGSTGHDFIGIVFWSMLLFVPLAIPAFAVLFPGTPATWIQLLPSYGLVEILLRTTGYGEGWSEMWPYLLVLGAWCLAVFAAGTSVLAWRVRRTA
jgi:ABC-2 type transport system permease protein